MTGEELATLQSRAREIRVKTIDAIGFLGVGHIGGAMSIVELLAVLYYRHLRHDPVNPAWAGRDRLVLSKGHAGPALYATLASRGFFPVEWLHTLNKGGTNLPSHCDRNKTPGIDMTTGSLGQGLSAACGLALADRLDGRDSFVFAVIGDGESNEGQNWEAALFAAQQGLSRLVAFTDYNKMQIDGKTDDILGLGALEEKWAAFGWETARVDGHDMAAIDAAITAAKARASKAAGTGGLGRPTMIVLDTIKGKGAKFCEGSVGSHNATFDYATAQKAIAELG